MEQQSISKQRVYSYGLPFSEKLGQCLDKQVLRVFELNKASLIIIDGAIGEGKTTLGIHCADYISGQPIEFDEQLGMGGGLFVKLLKKCYLNKYKVIIYDEGGDFNRRAALSKFNAFINRVFETYRAFKIIVIVILPSFFYLDSSLLDKGIARVLIHCYKRTGKQGNFSVYGLRRMHYLQANANKMKIRQQAFATVEPNFRGHFKNLYPERAAILDKYTTKGKLEMVEMGEIQQEGLVTYENISARLGRSIVWCRKWVVELKIQPARIYKKVRYFKPEVVSMLAEKIRTK